MRYQRAMAVNCSAVFLLTGTRSSEGASARDAPDDVSPCWLVIVNRGCMPAWLFVSADGLKRSGRL